jgi:hypothetical protein
VKVTRVALFSSGVGYFEHFGNVAGDGTTSIRFKSDQINDVLKSLVLQDLDGGSVSVVRYPSQDSLEPLLCSSTNDSLNVPASCCSCTMCVQHRRISLITSRSIAAQSMR